MGAFLVTVALIGLVIVVASLLSGALERSGLPLVAAFLALGALLGPFGLGVLDVGFRSPAIHALATLGLVLVLFTDAVSVVVREIRERWALVWRLLGPGTLLPAVAIAAAARVLLDLPWPAAAIVGAALASTDPVVLRSLLRSPVLPAGPRLALRLESGMNDAVLLPIVVLSMLVLRLRADAGGDGTEVARSVVGLFVLGPALGALVGWVGITLLVRVRSTIGVRRDYESLYALGLALTGYAAAESVGGSGFLAAFAAGLVVAMQDVELCDCFLEYGEATSEMLLLLTFVAFGASLIWTGLDVASPATLAFAAVALLARTAILYPMLLGSGVSEADRRVVALFGARGLSSLLFALLPVFGGVPGAERLFSVTALVVLLSVVLHGGGIALYLRTHRPADAPRPVPQDGPPLRITVEEYRAGREAGEPVVVVDARSARSYEADDHDADGAVRVDPDAPEREAEARRLPREATLVVFCA
jgi:NhaP-type Na+/H+ or K+/H+ antiporter